MNSTSATNKYYIHHLKYTPIQILFNQPLILLGTTHIAAVEFLNIK